MLHSLRRKLSKTGTFRLYIELECGAKAKCGGVEACEPGQQAAAVRTRPTPDDNVAQHTRASIEIQGGIWACKYLARVSGEVLSGDRSEKEEEEEEEQGRNGGGSFLHS